MVRLVANVHLLASAVVERLNLEAPILGPLLTPILLPMRVDLLVVILFRERDVILELGHVKVIHRLYGLVPVMAGLLREPLLAPPQYIRRDADVKVEVQKLLRIPVCIAAVLVQHNHVVLGLLVVVRNLL